MDLREGSALAGKYRLEEQIGEGGMATVWRAVQLPLSRPVAIKFLDVKGRSREDVGKRFLREARLLASVRHRMVVDILDFATTEDGQPYMVMELLEGAPFDEWLEQAHEDLEKVRVIGLALRGLAAVHDAGIVHRDLKPSNLFIVEDGDGCFPKLLDFGISKIVRPDAGELCSALTTCEGFLVGTPHYMSPEQARGLKNIDHRSDLFSMGVLLYEALTGRRPHESEHVGDLLINIAMGGAPPLAELRPDLGPGLDAVLVRAMQLSPERRYQDARSMASDLATEAIVLASLPAAGAPDPLDAAFDTKLSSHETRGAAAEDGLETQQLDARSRELSVLSRLLLPETHGQFADSQSGMGHGGGKELPHGPVSTTLARRMPVRSAAVSALTIATVVVGLLVLGGPADSDHRSEKRGSAPTTRSIADGAPPASSEAPRDGAGVAQAEPPAEEAHATGAEGAGHAPATAEPESGTTAQLEEARRARRRDRRARRRRAMRESLFRTPGY